MDEKFDLSLFEASDIGDLEVINIEGEPLFYEGKQVIIRMYGPGSKEALAAGHKLNTKDQARLFAGVRGKPLKEPEDQQRRDNITKLIACTHSVVNFPLAAAEIFENPKLGYITDQAIVFQKDWINFKPASTKNSASTSANAPG